MSACGGRNLLKGAIALRADGGKILHGAKNNWDPNPPPDVLPLCVTEAVSVS